MVPKRDLDSFAQSIGRPDMFGPEHHEAQLVVRRRGYKACVGSGHFVFTVRREVIAAMPDYPSLMAYKTSADRLWLDRPADQIGLWRLATTTALAHHMGNVEEPWMDRMAPLAADRAGSTDHEGAPTSAASGGIPDAKRRIAQRVPFRIRQATLRLVERRLARAFYSVLGHPRYAA